MAHISTMCQWQGWGAICSKGNWSTLLWPKARRWARSSWDSGSIRLEDGHVGENSSSCQSSNIVPYSKIQQKEKNNDLHIILGSFINLFVLINRQNITKCDKVQFSSHCAWECLKDCLHYLFSFSLTSAKTAQPCIVICLSNYRNPPAQFLFPSVKFLLGMCWTAC